MVVVYMVMNVAEEGFVSENKELFCIPNKYIRMYVGICLYSIKLLIRSRRWYLLSLMLRLATKARKDYAQSEGNSYKGICRLAACSLKLR